MAEIFFVQKIALPVIIVCKIETRKIQFCIKDTIGLQKFIEILINSFLAVFAYFVPV